MEKLPITINSFKHIYIYICCIKVVHFGYAAKRELIAPIKYCRAEKQREREGIN